MQTRRWVNPTQPQTLQIAVFLLYAHAVFGVLDVLSVGGRLPTGLLGLLYLASTFGGVPAGYGIANERKWGYAAGLAVAVLPFVIRLLYASNPFATNVINLMFEIALVALLAHPQSREYQRIWFK